MKILLAAVAALVVLALIGVAVVAATFDPNDYKGVVTDAFTARTGRTLVIDEDLRLDYFPWLAVETGGLTIGSAAELGGAAQPFATVTRVAARVKLLPLLSRNVEIGVVELEGLTLNLARDASLRGNWQDLIDAARADGADAPSAASSPTGQRLAIEGVRIRGGNIYWRENTDELRYSVTGLDLTMGGLGLREPVSFDSKLALKNESSGLTAALELRAVAAVAADGAVTARDVESKAALRAGNGAPTRTLAVTATTVAFDRVQQTLSVDGLATETEGVRARWQLVGSTLLDNPTVEGSVTLEPSQLEALFDELELSPPQGVAPGDLGTLALTTRFKYQAEPPVVTVADLEAQALGMTLRGAGTLTDGSELAGAVEIPEFVPNAALQGWLRAAVPPTVDVSALDRLALRTKFDTNLDSGRAALRGFEARVFGATIKADLEGVPGERGAVFRGSVTTSRFAAERFAKAFAKLLPPNLAPSELGTIEINTRFVFDAGADTVTVAPFDAEVFGLRAQGEVTGRNVSRAAVWTGTAKVRQFSPQDLLRRFGLPPQATSDPKAFARATLDTRFAVTKAGAELNDVVLVLDDTTIKGDFSLAGFDQPAYRFALDVDRVDADRYLPPKGRDAAPGEATAGDIELPQNNTMNLDGTMRVGALALAGMQFTDVGSRIVIGGGDLELADARARLYGGTFNGRFHVRGGGGSPGLTLEGRAAGLQLEPIITALTAEPANVSGTGSFDLSLNGQGRTVIENVRTASGNVSFNMSDGAIKGFNLGSALCSAYNVTQRAPAPAAQPAQTEYEGIKGSAVVTNGTASSRDLLARTAFMDITGTGTLALAEQQLDYELDATLTAPIAIRGCDTMDQFVGGALPFKIRGIVTEPVITPDFSKLVRRQLRDELQDRIKDRLRDILR